MSTTFDWRGTRCPRLLVDAKLAIRQGKSKDKIKFLVSDKRFCQDLTKLQTRWPFIIVDINRAEGKTGEPETFTVSVQLD